MLLAFRFAARELRAGVRGFRVFLACLALGVAAIAAAGSTAEAFRMGLASQASEILGGDVAITLRQRQFTPAEHEALERVGRVSYAVSAAAMAESASGDRRLVEMRGVAGPYPLVGKVELSGGDTLAQALAPEGEAAGAAVEQPLLDKLHIKIGDHFRVGNVPMVARAVLVSEPDRLSRGFSFGPRVLTRSAVVVGGGFLVPGLPFGETARVVLRPGAPLAPAERLLRQAMKASGAGGYRLHDRTDATPGLSRLIDELEYFLGFIGLASLVAGGLGVFGAVSAFLDGKTESIAVLKALGAKGDLARDVYLIQIGLLALLGVVIGLAFGAVIPLVLGEAIKGVSPVPALFAVYPEPLGRAAAFGLLAAAAFGFAPLGRARSTPPSALFRGDLSRVPRFSFELAGALIAGAGASRARDRHRADADCRGGDDRRGSDRFRLALADGRGDGDCCRPMARPTARARADRRRQLGRTAIGRANRRAGDRARRGPAGCHRADSVQPVSAGREDCSIDGALHGFRGRAK